MMCKTFTPETDRQQYRQTLGRFATGVAVVTTRDTENMPVGMTLFLVSAQSRWNCR